MTDERATEATEATELKATVTLTCQQAAMIHTQACMEIERNARMAATWRDVSILQRISAEAAANWITIRELMETCYPEFREGRE